MSLCLRDDENIMLTKMCLSLSRTHMHTHKNTHSATMEIHSTVKLVTRCDVTRPINHFFVTQVESIG